MIGLRMAQWWSWSPEPALRCQNDANIIYKIMQQLLILWSIKIRSITSCYNIPWSVHKLDILVQNLKMETKLFIANYLGNIPQIHNICLS